MEAFTEGSLLAFLATVPDPRRPSWTATSPLGHPLFSVLRHHVRRESYAAIGRWAQDQDVSADSPSSVTRAGPPSAGGIRKVLIALDRKAFEHALTRWAEAWSRRADRSPPQRHGPRAYALDGKLTRELRRPPKAVHLLSLLAHESGLTLAAGGVPNGGEDKTKRAQSCPSILEGLVLQGRIVTGDAICCHAVSAGR